MAQGYANIRMVIKARQIGKYERALGKQMRPTYIRITKTVARNLVRLLRQKTSEKGIFWRGRFYRGWSWERVSWDRVLIYNRSDHAIFVETGRRKGRMPPLKAIRPWARETLGDANLAWPVAKAIARRGVKARPVMSSRSFKTQSRQMIQRDVLNGLKRAARNAKRAV